MKTTTTIGILRAAIGNPATRKALKGISKYCEKDHKNRIEVALELYTGRRKKEDACLSCRAAEKVIASVIKRGAKAFGVTEEEVKEKFRDPYWAKGLASTIMGISKFGVTRPFTPGAPYQIVWDVSYACNLHCKHCYATAGKPWKDELTTEEAKRAIDIFDRAGVAIISFSGGEPLVRPDILELIRYAADKGIYIAMATNGTLISRKKAKEMKEAGVQFLQISLDGADAETHDNFRGWKGAFDLTINGIKNAVAEGFFVEIATTITRFNLKQVPEIIDLAERLGANWFMAYNFVPTGRGKDIIEMDLSPEEREELLKTLWHELKTRKINVLSTAPQFARVALMQESGTDEKIVPTHFYNPKFAGQLVDLAEFIGGCGAGRFYMSMRANGNLQPCVFLPVTVGNIRRDNFEDIWDNNKVLRELRDKDLMNGGCGTCPYRYYCGGCRARAYAYTGDYLASDPGCLINRGDYQRIAKGLEEGAHHPEKVAA